MFAWSYGALNLVYLLVGAFGAKRALRADRVLALSMIAYIGLRCALLLTLDNAEQRYTLEFFPILFVFGAAALTRWEPVPEASLSGSSSREQQRTPEDFTRLSRASF